MTKKHCCYGLCTSDSRYFDKPHMKDVFFINFPKPKTKPEKCKRWIHLCGRPSETFNVDRVNKGTFICSKHFFDGKGPTVDHPDPIPATATLKDLEKRKAPSKRELVETNTGGRGGTTSASQDHKHRRLDAAEALFSLHKSFLSETQTSSMLLTSETQTGLQQTSTESQTEECKTDVASQTIYDKYILQSLIETMTLRNQINLRKPAIDKPLKHDKTILNLDSIMHNDKKMKFLTGLVYFQFFALFKFLGPVVNNLNYWGQSKRSRKVSLASQKTRPIDELFICLVRLRRGYCFETMSLLFHLSKTSLRRIFTTWLQFLYHHFNDLRSVMFPDRSALRKFIPASFKGFKNVRCSVDCTEFFCEMPGDFKRQGNLFSNYKSHHTMKCLIAVAPNGAGVFVSNLFEGAISDREIFEQCGILEYLNPGDLLLVDRGFTVEDLLMARQVNMNIPPFLKGRDKLSAREELLTKKIAKARIHVERYNERIKKFRLISGRIPLNMSHLASQAVFVACCLVNFQKQLAS